MRRKDRNPAALISLHCLESGRRFGQRRGPLDEQRRIEAPGVDMLEERRVRVGLQAVATPDIELIPDRAANDFHRQRLLVGQMANLDMTPQLAKR